MPAEWEYEIQGDYGHGWEMLTTEATWDEGQETLRTYRENEPATPHRMKRVRAAGGGGRGE